MPDDNAITASDNNEPVARHNSRANLERLLTQMIEQPERRAEISGQLETEFGQQKAVMVLDMSGFSRTTQRLGIASFLLMIHQMQLVARPCVEAHQGLLVKAEADNLLCLFDTVAQAVKASRNITRHLGVANLLLPDDQRLYVSIGIGFGTILNIEDEDIFGNEVNLAAKLGEDIARMGDILLTDAAREQLDGSEVSIREESISISGIDLKYFAVDA
ncbi:MAG: adenylate/guanylate cyclase domain-containing protein [Pyrinomonadaceae bacterium]|nr:adenylate/guanylate cyclase domain-containing protein [Pyrinomonadaceae bacterium]